MVQYSGRNVAYDAFQEDTDMRRRRRQEDREAARQMAKERGLYEGLRNITAGGEQRDGGDVGSGRTTADKTDDTRQPPAVSPGGGNTGGRAGPTQPPERPGPGGSASGGAAGPGRDENYGPAMRNEARGYDQERAQAGAERQQGERRGRDGMRSVGAGQGGSEGFRDPITQALLDQGPAAATAAYERYTNVASTRREQAQSARERQNELEEQAIDALNEGNMAGYYHYASQAGMQLPESILQNTRARQLFGQGAKLAKEVYGDNEAQAGRFTQAYIQSGGDAAAAYQAAGTPQDRPSYTIEEVMRDEERILMRINERTGRGQPITDDQGNVVRAGEQPGQDGGADDLTEAEAGIRRIKNTVTTDDGQPISDAEAQQIYYALRNPDARARIIADQLEQWRDNQYGDVTEEDLQRKRQEIEQWANSIMGLSGYDLSGGRDRQPAPETDGQGGNDQARREPPPGQGGDRGSEPVITYSPEDFRVEEQSRSPRRRDEEGMGMQRPGPQ
jgi:hypothetical protein